MIADIVGGNRVRDGGVNPGMMIIDLHNGPSQVEMSLSRPFLLNWPTVTTIGTRCLTHHLTISSEKEKDVFFAAKAQGSSIPGRQE